MKNFALILTLVVATAGSLNTFAQKPQGPNAAGAEIEQPAGTERVETGSTYFRVSGNTVRYHTYRMTAGERVRIELVGDGDTDLDLYVYDGAGNLVDSREGMSDIETSYITANRSGTMTVKVVNRGGLYNMYDLSVWTL